MQTLITHWQSFDWSIAALVLAVYILIDGMYAYYTLAVADKNALRSANTGALMHFLIAFGVISYVQNYLYILPLALDSWIGTYLVVVRESRR
jgi:hypothetical protein